MSKFTLYTPDYVAEDEYIHINQCGILGCKGRWANAFRPNGRKDYLLLYVLGGHCILNRTSGKPITVEKGNAIVYKPNEPQYYTFPRGNETIQIYIHFTGTGCEQLFKDASINKRIIKPSHQNEFEYYLQRICNTYDPHDKRKVLQCNGLLMACFGLIAERDGAETKYNTQKYHKQISAIVGQIQTEPHFSYSVEDWAAQCNISTHRFINVFKATTGYSPLQYLTKTRMSYAKELLLFTDLGIAEISNLCGYTDQNYFTRVFKKNIGLTPSEFRIKEKR